MSTKHLDQKQLAERWNLSAKTLERWRWLGEGPSFLKLGGRVVYRLEDIETYEQQQLRSCTSTHPEFLRTARTHRSEERDAPRRSA